MPSICRRAVAFVPATDLCTSPCRGRSACSHFAIVCSYLAFRLCVMFCSFNDTTNEKAHSGQLHQKSFGQPKRFPTFAFTASLTRQTGSLKDVGTKPSCTEEPNPVNNRT